MSIGPMILEVGEPTPFDLHPRKKGYVRQLTVYCPIRKTHFVISENTVLEETLIFESDPEGNFKTSLEVAGGKGYTLEEVLEAWVDGSLNWHDAAFDC